MSSSASLLENNFDETSNDEDNFPKKKRNSTKIYAFTIQDTD